MMKCWWIGCFFNLVLKSKCSAYFIYSITYIKALTNVFPRFWVENVADHAEIFPHAEFYGLELEMPTVLGTTEKRPKCHYGPTQQVNV